MVSIFWTIVTIPLISIVGYAVKYLYQDYTSPLKKIPRIPNPSFFFGNAKEFMDAETGIIQRKWSRILPFGIFMSRFFMSYRVTITDPKALAKVLVTNCYDYPKPERTRLFLTMILGNGVLVAEGFEHKKQRRSLDSAFSLQRIKAIAPLFHAPSHKLAMKWVELIKKEGGKNGLDKDQVVMDVMSWLSRCTLDIIGSAGFDYEFDSLENPNNELAVAYNELFGEGLKPSLLFFALNTVVSAFPFLIPVAEKVNNRYKIIKKNRIIVERTAQRLLDQKREELKAAGNVIDEANLKKDILSVLVRDNLGHGDPLTDTEIKDQCLTFLAAGHETTATALTWSLLRLAENHAVQDRLREEVLQKFGDKLDEPIQFEELHSLPYLNAFTREVLRLDHPVPMTLRVAAKDDVLCGYQIPKGTNIVIPPATVHYHPDIWGPDAEVFDPTRFIEEGRIPDPAKGPYANLTFIAGPRNCIGTKFALAEMKAILVQLVARFRFDVAEVKHIERRTGLVMTPKGKILNLKVSLAK